MNAPHRAKKSLGQNFLTDPAIQQRIVESLDPQPDDTIIEIGPGQGALTRHLQGSVRRLVLIELDNALAPALAREYDGRGDVEVIHADVLRVDLCAIAGGGRYKVVGNIPYNITTPIMFKLLERGCRPAMIVLMVQKELADRVISGPGNKTYGALSVGVQAVADVQRLFNVRRGAFNPVPNVDSAVIRITPHEPPMLTAEEEADLRTLSRTSFGWRRKQLQKILRSAPQYGLDPDAVANVQTVAGIAPDARPETLSPAQFILLARILRHQGLPFTSEDSSDWD